MGNILSALGNVNQQATQTAYAQLIQTIQNRAKVNQEIADRFSQSRKEAKEYAMKKDALQAQQNAQIMQAWQNQSLQEMLALKDAGYSDAEVSQRLEQKRQDFYNANGYSTQQNFDSQAEGLYQIGKSAQKAGKWIASKFKRDSKGNEQSEIIKGDFTIPEVSTENKPKKTQEKEQEPEEIIIEKNKSQIPTQRE